MKIYLHNKIILELTWYVFSALITRHFRAYLITSERSVSFKRLFSLGHPLAWIVVAFYIPGCTKPKELHMFEPFWSQNTWGIDLNLGLFACAKSEGFSSVQIYVKVDVCKFLHFEGHENGTRNRAITQGTRESRTLGTKQYYAKANSHLSKLKGIFTEV